MLYINAKSIILKNKVYNLFLLIKNKVNSIFLKKASFGLIETVVTLGIVGTMAGIGLSAYKSTNPQYRNDIKKMQAIEDALQKFFSTNGRLPAPARPQDCNVSQNYLKENTTDGFDNYSSYSYFRLQDSSHQEDLNRGRCLLNLDTNVGTQCTACANRQLLWGVVPTRTLGLPDEYAYDSYGHNFEYVIDWQMAIPVNETTWGNDNCKKTYVTDLQGKYVPYYISTNVNATTKQMEFALFPISIYNATLSTPTLVYGTTQNVAYVIISKSTSNECYWDNKSSTLVSDGTIPTDNTKYNCRANYTRGTFSELKIYQGYSKSKFNNLVKYKTLTDLIHTNASVRERTNELSGSNPSVYQTRNDPRLQTSSKNLVEAINEVSNAMTGTILMFYSNEIPQGWQLCNGFAGTPDLRNNTTMGANVRFICKVS